MLVTGGKVSCGVVVVDAMGTLEVVATADVSASALTLFVVFGTAINAQMTIAANDVATKTLRPCEPCAHFALCRMGCSIKKYEAMLRANVIARRIAVSAKPLISNRSCVQKIYTGQCQRYSAYESRPIYASGRHEKTTDNLVLEEATRTASRADAIE